MKLMTKELLERFEKVGKQEESADPIVIAKYFLPTGAFTWYATEFDTAQDAFFGFVTLGDKQNDEWGSFSLEELEEVKGVWGLGVERDLHFSEQPISKLMPHAIFNK